MITTTRLLHSIYLILLLLLSLSTISYAQENIHHEMKIVLYPEKHRIEVEDKITFPETLLPNSESTVHFILHSGLRPKSLTKGVKIVPSNKKELSRQSGIDTHPLDRSENIAMDHFSVSLPANQRSFTIEYEGEIFIPLQNQMEESDRSFKETPGLISKKGVYLAKSTYWYPLFNDDLVTFSIDVKVPQKWNAISQGERTLFKQAGKNVYVKWESQEPQDEIYLIAGQFAEYSRQEGPVKTFVFLRNPDKKLASKYLETGARYLKMYSKLIDPYPYKKFALIENFWETGFGMPSFSLLGPKIIRFPFILHSSFPHEILHNWWANGVFVDIRKGNWSEGLTAYLSDHLVKEQRGKGAEYRRTTLQKYTDYVSKSKDFPLIKFQSRHSPVTEAVGYGKTLMFFHMLRMQLGDEVFINSLQKFYRENKFKHATFENLREAFSSVSGEDLENEFDQWINRTGAPELRIDKTATYKDGDKYILTAVLEQVQQGPVYKLQIPLAVHLKGHESAYQTTVLMTKKRLQISLHLPAFPFRLDVDPEFDLFRRLNRNEIPPALSQAFGSDKALIILPATAEKDILQGFRHIAESWQKSQSRQIEIKLDIEVDELPADRTVWLFGWENRFKSKFISCTEDYGVLVNDNEVHIQKSEIKRKNHSIVLTARNPGNPNFAIVWVTADNTSALSGLGRKLPHYGKYSYLGFEGTEPSIILKGRWPTLNSPMSVMVEQTNRKGVPPSKLAPRSALAYLPTVFSEDRMMDVIRFLADKNMKGRGFGSPELNKAADFIASKFQEAGLKPAGSREKSYFQKWKARGGDPEREVILKNIIGIIPGNRPEWDGQSVLISAHYDHLGLGWPDVREGNKGEIHPGADDNASGIAILLELAQLLGKSLKPDRTVVFAAFAGEEAGRLGSKHYVANEKRFSVDKCIGMLNLDTVGRLGKNKLMIFGTGSAREWIHIFMGASYVTGVSVEPVADDFGSSDQKSFLDAGIPAVQFFSGPHLDFHSPTDTVDKVDKAGLVKIASVVKEAIEYLANREKPLTSMLDPQRKTASGQTTESAESASGRKVSLGTIPDFAYSGKGVRIIGVLPGSPAEKASLHDGDIITLLNNVPIDDLRSFSNLLKTLKPGNLVIITFLREGKEKRVQMEVVAR